jgi:hypothetical protein
LVRRRYSLWLRVSFVMYGAQIMLGVDRHERPIAAIDPPYTMLRCGPSDRTFAATAKSSDG